MALDIFGNWDGVCAKGRKIVQGGKLGSQTWDIGTIGPASFKE